MQANLRAADALANAVSFCAWFWAYFFDRLSARFFQKRGQFRDYLVLTERREDSCHIVARLPGVHASVARLGIEVHGGQG